MGLLVLGIGLSSPCGALRVLFHMLGHSLSRPCCSFGRIFHRQYESNKYFQIKNAFKLQPLASWGLILGSLSVLGVPLFPIFLSKLNILAGLADFSLAGLVIVLILLFIIASSFGYYLVRAFNSKEDETELKVYNTPKSMKWPIVFIIVILLVLGLYMPGGLADLISG